MVRKKNDSIAQGEAAQEQRRQKRMDRVRQYSPVPVSDPPFPEVLTREEYRNQQRADLRTTIEASLIPLPNDQGDDFIQPHDDEPLFVHDEGQRESVNITSGKSAADGKRTHASRTKHFDGKMSKKDYDEKMDRLRQIWKRNGYYDNHPNHNAANASEDELKDLFKNHHRLGPIVKQYDLYLNPSKGRTILLMFPSRESDQEYRALYDSKPLELRFKPKCGLVELDVPINIHKNYDKERGIMYGEAMRNDPLLRRGGSYGLAGGLGVDMKPSKDNQIAPLPPGPSVDKLLDNFDDANNKGHVMNKITLGGQIYPYRDGQPILMVATFQGNMCTWTKLDGYVKMRPTFEHVNALHESQKEPPPPEPSVDEDEDDDSDDSDESEESDPTASAMSKDTEPKAVNMTVKSTGKKKKGDDDYIFGNMKETAKVLRAMRDEPWQRLKWIDQDEEESFEIYDEHLVYQDPENAPKLLSELTEEQYLKAISYPRLEPKEQGKRIRRTLGGDVSPDPIVESDHELEELNLDDTEDEEEAEKLPTGVTRPDDRRLRTRIETVCRMICSKPPKQHRAAEAHLKKKLRGRLEYRFFDPYNQHYRYYKWRMAENKAGRGYPPESDLPELPPGSLI